MRVFSAPVDEKKIINRGQFWQKWFLKYHWVLALALYTLFSLLITFPIILNLNEKIIGPPEGDNLWYVWDLWWFKHAIDSGLDPARTNFIFGLVPSVPIFNNAFFDLALAYPLQWIFQRGPTGEQYKICSFTYKSRNSKIKTCLDPKLYSGKPGSSLLC